MKRAMTRLFALVLAIACCIGTAGSALAATRASFYLTTYTAKVVAGSNGNITIVVETVANKRSNQIGAEHILLEESTDGGRTWTTAAEYEGESWMTDTNRLSHKATTTYYGTAGYRYRVTATVFAYNSATEQDSKTVGPSSSVTAKK
ncbi:hypothetical protein D1159_17340 [Pseudoflavonifractor sp. 524-17]|uniref:hypothetical protein n=1 Tax=Pseudoflavonifractor sp. 524-17 TaxID=2304577 RepID=UPI00137A802D|nr:hypothetical protein [Pseudoflavonifractor sp. 524-17]NCE66289.1 hypothetical protein [Pseudoflavonifractor sp. 524-17]